MANEGMGSRVFGLPLGMAVGLVGLVVSMGILGLIWKEQFSSLGKGAEALGVKSGGPLGTIDATRITATVTKMREAAAALEQFRAENGGYPEDVKQAMRRLPADSWGAPMEYEASGKPAGRSAGQALRSDYDIVSRGSDGLSGTDDDLVMHNGVVDMSFGEDAEEEESSGTAADPGTPATGGDEPRATTPGSRAIDAARDAAGTSRGRTDESGE